MKVHELLNNESKWTQTYTARNKNNNPVSANSPDAIKWCTSGAIQKCYGMKLAMFTTFEILNKLRKEIKKTGKYLSIGHWNDKSDYKTIYNTLKKLDI